jgi:predicted nuclease with TOPRIM domain
VKKRELQTEYNNILEEINDIYENISYLARRLEELEVDKAHTYDQLQKYYGNYSNEKILPSK